MPVAQPAQRVGDLLGGADEHVGDLLGLLHRRLDAVEPELVGGLLGVVDDVVERAGERVHVGRVERRAPRAVLGEPVQDVVGDPVALLLAQRACRAPSAGALGIVGEHVAQQQRGALHVAPRLLEELEQHGVGPAREPQHGADASAAAPRLGAPFTTFSQRGSPADNRDRARRRSVAVRCRQREAEVLEAGELEIRPPSTWRCAGGPTLALSVRSSSCWRRWRGARAASCRGRSSTRRSGARRCGRTTARWTSTSTSSARSSAEALPEWQFIHTHFGFGYRFQPEPSHPFHKHGHDR